MQEVNAASFITVGRLRPSIINREGINIQYIHIQFQTV